MGKLQHYSIEITCTLIWTSCNYYCVCCSVTDTRRSKSQIKFNQLFLLPPRTLTPHPIKFHHNLLLTSVLLTNKQHYRNHNLICQSAQKLIICIYLQSCFIRIRFSFQTKSRLRKSVRIKLSLENSTRNVSKHTSTK